MKLKDVQYTCSKCYLQLIYFLNIRSGGKKLAAIKRTRECRSKKKWRGSLKI